MRDDTKNGCVADYRNGGSRINPCCSVLLLSRSSFSTLTNQQVTVVPQSKSTELCSHKVNLPASCEAQRLLRHHRGPTQSVCVADCYFIVNVLDLPFASPIAIYR